MPQYRPLYKAKLFPEIDRPIFLSEYVEALELAKKMGFKNIYID